ncbi:MAG: 30S ribosome-binding factor RbfA [Chloroflexi bacterium]|nr:MAG: 30S ribosome-binding factor RbfA [Chloroflexota bacterium]
MAPGQRVVSRPPRSEAELREAIGPRFRVSQRTQRLDELLRQEIGAMLEREIADPRIGFATVTSVETTPDLRHARVWVSIIGGDAQREGTIAALEHAMVFVRRELGTRLRLKRIPDLHVRLDDSIERGTRVLRLIDSLEAGVEPSDEPPGESLPTPRRSTPAGAGRPTSDDSEGATDGFGAAAAEFAADLAERRKAARDSRSGDASGDRGRPPGARKSSPAHGSRPASRRRAR